MNQPLTPEEEEAKARREKVEKLAGQAFDAASGAAKQASDLANKAFAFGQETLGKVDVEALKRTKWQSIPKKPAMIASGAVLVLLVFSLLGGDSQEKGVKRYYEALASGNIRTLEDTVYLHPDTPNPDMVLERISEQALARFKSRDGFKSVESKCGKIEERSNMYPRSGCLVTLHMKDGTEIDDGVLFVVKKDGKWLAAF